MVHEGTAYPGMPRWVKVAGLAALALLLLAVVAGILLGVEHGPARHATP